MVSRRHNTAADVAGVSTGTGYISVINLIPDGHPFWKSLAIYAAPMVAVLVRVIWIAISTYIGKRLSMKAFLDARQNLIAMRMRIYADPNSTELHKKEIQEQIEKLEKLQMDATKDDYKTVRARIKELD